MDNFFLSEMALKRNNLTHQDFSFFLSDELLPCYQKYISEISKYQIVFPLQQTIESRSILLMG